jgi:hypothetical protein
MGNGLVQAEWLFAVSSWPLVELMEQSIQRVRICWPFQLSEVHVFRQNVSIGQADAQMAQRGHPEDTMDPMGEGGPLMAQSINRCATAGLQAVNHATRTCRGTALMNINGPWPRFASSQGRYQR